MTSPIEKAKQLTPVWMMEIRSFNAIEVHPCCVVSVRDGVEEIETCERDQAEFWSVYGHYITGGLSCFEDFPTEEAALAFAERLRSTYRHLAGTEGGTP